MFQVIEVLSQPERKWHRQPPACEAEMNKLLQACDLDLPAEYLDLLRFSNGGNGELALPPRLLMLYSIDEVIEAYQDEANRELYPGFFIFGSNGGMEWIGFDRRHASPWPVVMMDPIAGEESAVEIAPNMEQFIEFIGLRYPETRV